MPTGGHQFGFIIHHHLSKFITIWGTPHNELGLYLSVVDTEPSRVKYDDLLYIRKGIMESHNQTPNGLTKKIFSTCTLKIFEGPQSSRPKNDWVCLRIGHPQIPLFIIIFSYFLY